MGGGDAVRQLGDSSGQEIKDRTDSGSHCAPRSGSSFSPQTATHRMPCPMSNSPSLSQLLSWSLHRRFVRLAHSLHRPTLISMVKSYLRYVADRPFGVIAAPNANVLLHPNGVWAITPAQEYIHIYQLQQGTLLHSITHLGDASIGGGGSSSVSSPPSVRVLCAHPSDPNTIAAGYDDGSIRLFSLTALACTLTLHGHTATVTCLAFNRSGTLLVSGAADTAVICWDVVAQKGVVRLKGHRDAVTCIALIDRQQQSSSALPLPSVSVSGLVALSGSKDGSVRVWDVEAQHCRQSVMVDKEVWGLAVSQDLSFVVAGGVDSTIKVWRVRAEGLEAEMETDESALQGRGTSKRQRTGLTADTSSTGNESGSVSGGGSALDSDELLSPMGSLPRLSSKRVVSVALSSDGALLSVQSADRMLEMWAVRSAQQLEKRKRSRRKRQQKEASKKETQEEEKEADEEGASDRLGAGVDADDLLSGLPPLRTDVKIASVSLTVSSHKRSAGGAAASHRLLLSLADNSVALYGVTPTAAASSSTPSSSSALYSLLSSVELPGHRSPIRTLGLSSDQSLLLSGSSDQLKLHSLHSQQVVRTLQCGSAALCCLFVPGNKHVVVGCKDGSIAWYELGSARCLGSVAAHDGHSVYSIHLRPDGRGFTSGGGDKCVRQWEFELVADEGSATGGRVLSIVLARTLTLTDDVLCVRHSPNGKYVAVGLLDSTVKLFHSDTLLFFLSLYGHRLPVLSIDFSSDSQLLASASADKNVKVWGVAFGDCQCSLFAHADTVTQVRFIPRTHYVASAGKDGMVKLWDADTRQCIQELPGHTTEVWALEAAAAPAASTTQSEGAGELLVSAGNDRSIRVWRQSDEMLFVEEERENRRDALLDSKEVKQGRLGDAEGAGQRVEVEGDMVSAAVTAETIKGAEGLLEAIDLAHAEKQRVAAFQKEQQHQQHQQQDLEGSTSLDRALQQLTRTAHESKPPPAATLSPNPFLRGLSADAYVLSVLSALPPSSVDDCLQQLPFSYALRLMDCLGGALESGESNVELAVSALIALLATHDRLIISNRLLVADMQRLRRLVRERLRAIKDGYGRNRAALQLLQKTVDEQRSQYTFGQPTL